jgi:uncharacterized protein YhdP
LLISNDEFSVQSHLKIFNEHGNDFVEFNSYIEQMQASDAAKYLPAKTLSDDTHAWIKREFVSGKLEDIQFYLKKNLSTSTIVETRFDAHLRDMELLFNSDWGSLKKLDATLKTDGKKIVVMVHSTQLNEMVFNDIKVQILDMSQDQLEMEVIGKINTQSENLIEFLHRAPLSETVNEALSQFTLTGGVTGDMKLVVPLDERESILDIDLVFKDNRLTALDGTIVIKDYDSKLAFHHGEITSKGEGDIRGTTFDIYINPNNRGDDSESAFGVELVNNDSNFEIYITKRLNQSWRARIESEDIKGNIEVVMNDGGNPSVVLSGLQVNTLEAIKGDWDITPDDFPSMYLSTKGVYVDENELPNFSAELYSQDNILAIKNLQFDGVGVGVGSEALSFNGHWLKGRTRLKAKAKGKGLAEFLQNLKVKEKVTGGEFDLDIRLSCECTPWNMNYQDVTGYVAIKVKEGVFTEKDSNIGRILSLLNIKSIAKLDVGDATKEGFAYENIDARIYIGNALAKIDKFELNATSGVIRLTGQSHIINEEYEMTAKVSPAVGDAVPVATALAGGGAIGLGVWLIDEALFEGKLIDKIVDKVVDIEYKITGPWDDPIIE